MKFYSLVLGFCAVAISQTFADLTIVQSVEGMGPVSQMTMKIKGDKARIDVSPQMTMIFDAKKGEMISLMREQKMVVRMPADKMKAAADLIRKSNGKESAEKPKIVATGKKETVNGYETEQYSLRNAEFQGDVLGRNQLPGWGLDPEAASGHQDGCLKRAEWSHAGLS